MSCKLLIINDATFYANGCHIFIMANNRKLLFKKNRRNPENFKFISESYPIFAV